MAADAMRQIRLPVLTVVCAAALSPITGRADEPRTVWSGVYGQAQAARGQVVLDGQCALCHGQGLQGGGGVPAMVGPAFRFKWKGKPLAELFAFLQKTMPPAAPGSLSPQQYADTLAAILKRNGFPAGDGVELPADAVALADVRITASKP